jgi:hypothetical protein
MLDSFLSLQLRINLGCRSRYKDRMVSRVVCHDSGASGTYLQQRPGPIRTIALHLRQGCEAHHSVGDSVGCGF